MTLGGELTHVRSADGSSIAVERLGSGPDLVAIHGGTADRSRWAPVADALGETFTLHLIDRRGRGDSKDEAAGYALDREVDDVLAVIADVGGPVHLLGHSYGGLIGLETLPRTDLVARALLYEPAFGPEIAPPGVFKRIGELVDAGEREAALETFYRDVIDVDPAPLKPLPIWQARLAAVHTLVREAAVAEAYAPDRSAFLGVSVPLRVLLGTESPAPFRDAAESTITAVPGSELVELSGQGHTMIDADPSGFVAQLRDFLGQA